MSIAGLNDTNFQDVFVALSTAYQQGFNKVENLKHQDVAMITRSSGKSSTYPLAGFAPQLREWIGDREIRSTEVYAYNLVNKKYEGTIEVKRDDLEDDELGTIALQAMMLGASARKHMDKLVFELLNSSRTELCYDGQAFHSAAHPSHDGDAQSNIDSGGGGPYWYLMDTSNPIKPLILQMRRDPEFTALTDPKDENVFKRDSYLYGVSGRMNAGFGMWQFSYASNQSLDATNFAAAVEEMMKVKNDQGHPMGIVPDTLVVPPSLFSDARSVVGVERLANGGSNQWFGAAKIVVSPYLDNA